MTAGIVCVARGIGISSRLRDHAAASFAPGWTGRAVEVFDRDTALMRAARWVLRAITFGLIDHNTIRMFIVDEFLRGWLHAGCTQVVILGAGLDARSWRMPELNDVTVFELDQPSTQRIKAQRAASLPKQNSNVIFVPVDLKSHDLAQLLLGAGYRKDQRTCWICEGVTPYLDIGTIAQLLRITSEISAIGSKFSISYITPSQRTGAAVSRKLLGYFVSKLGEPAPGAVTQATMQNLADAAGLHKLEDIGWEDWVMRIPDYSRMPNLLQERMIVAEKR